MFVVNLIFLKIFIAIILQGYNDMQTQDGRLFNIDMNEKFRDTWTEFDPDVIFCNIYFYFRQQHLLTCLILETFY
jgi:hypothetical protein